LVEWLLTNLSREQYRTVLVRNPQIDSDNFLLTMARQLGGGNLPMKRTELLTSVVLESLEDVLLANHKKGLSTVVVVDEAHLIADPRVLETVRLVLNLHASGEFLITLILAGQPDLKGKVESMRQLEQRIAVKCCLEPLSEKECGAYVDHRLKKAGAAREIFSPAARRLIYEHSGGIPRRINRVCDLSLVVGFGLNAETVDEKVASVVVQDIEGTD
jgi:general secretion pathway protein A